MAASTSSLESTNAWLEGSEMEFQIEIKKELLDMFSYQGFSPGRIEKLILGTPGFSENEIALLLDVNAQIGPNTAQYARRLKPDVALKVNSLVAKYNIKTKPRNRDNTTITMPRLQAAFPILAGRIASERGYKDGLGGDCPPPYRFSAAASIIDPDDVLLKNLHMDWLLRSDKKINAGRGDAVRVEKYFNIMLNSQHIPVEDRRAFYNKFMPK